MKRYTLILLAAMALCFGACTEKVKPNEQPNIPETFNMANTTWVGHYKDYMTHPQAGQVPVNLKWTIDFDDKDQAELFLEADADGQVQPGRTFNFTYRMEGLNGTLIYDDGEDHSEDHFVVDPYNNTFDLELVMPMGFSAEDQQQVGGITTFHLMLQ